MARPRKPPKNALERQKRAYKDVIHELNKLEPSYMRAKQILWKEIEKDENFLMASVVAWNDFFNTLHWKAYEKSYYEILPRIPPNPKRQRLRGYLKKADWKKFVDFWKTKTKAETKVKDAGKLVTPQYKSLTDELVKERILRREYEGILKAYNLLPDEE